MRVMFGNITRTIKTGKWWVIAVVTVVMAVNVVSLDGPNVCVVKQKYNITKRVKYRAPMAVRSYVWCFAIPPRCSRWSTEMKDLTRLETEERTAEMSVCCPGYKLRDVSCVPICPNGKTGHGCSEDCPPNKWGPNCVHDCKACEHGLCSPTTGQCQCQEGWQGESCETMSTTPAVMMEQLLTTAYTTVTTKTTPSSIATSVSTNTSTSMTTESSPITSPMTTVILSTTNIPTQKTTVSATMRVKDITAIKESQKPLEPTVTDNPGKFNNITLTTLPTNNYKSTEEVIKKDLMKNSIYNRTELPVKAIEATHIIKPVTMKSPSSMFTTEKALSTLTKPKLTTALTIVTTESTPLTTSKEIPTTKSEMTRKHETTTRQLTTVKFEAKEIWIRPAQKGESPLVETKIKPIQELPQKYKTDTKKESVSENTTPRTIIVSIIPTSVSYATFKKIALSTAQFMSHKNNITLKPLSKSTEGYTKPMIAQTTSTPTTIKVTNATTRKLYTTTINPILQNVTKAKYFTSFTTKGIYRPTVSTYKITNSMSSTLNAVNKGLNTSNLLTTVSVSSTNVTPTTRRSNISLERTSSKPVTSDIISEGNITTEHPSISKQFVTILQRNITVKPVTDISKVTKSLDRTQADTNESMRNLTNIKAKTTVVTDDPTNDEETFHILTEPEHITAVMGDKGTERASVDLISVISIAGGVMMAVITVAVVIVMVERCKRPRYEDVRKFNDIRMQVMIDKNDVPPPYVRSIFHTPLPEPPTPEKCHYQPISTLDRNLKQFMRPVVVQTISPLMLENFRGILECHYDHLPRRSQDVGAMQTRRSMAPSINEREELLHQRAHSMTDSAIEAMKCEAQLDVIDNTTSEPLYAEIPCWRPPSEHAIEIVNLNGEAVTEL